MATTTKSKSTRTTTKKPAKATKKTNVNNTKIITKTTVTSKSKTRDPLTPLDRIRSLHVSSAFANFVFAGLIIGFASTAAVAVTLGLQARDQFASNNNVVLGPASEVLYNIKPEYVLAAALILSGLFSLLLASKLRARYESTLVNRTSGMRWVALGITAGLLITFANLLAGVTDATTLKLSGFLIFMTTMLSFMAERENVSLARPKWLAYSLSLLTGVLAWLPLFGSLIGTSVYGMERFGWHVYAVVAVLLLGFTGFALNQYAHLKSGTRKDYLSVEEKYLRIDMFTKFAVVVIVLLALK
ncbi:MAG: hypothetical protein ACR2FM_05165 [Candidatus Saccharimonadales bacterium]